MIKMWLWLREACECPTLSGWMAATDSRIIHFKRKYEQQAAATAELQVKLADFQVILQSLATEVNSLRNHTGALPQQPIPTLPRRVSWRELKKIAADDVARRIEQGANQ